MSILLIRHGKTESNIKKIYMGQSDEPLSSLGREEITNFILQGVYPPVSQIFSSPLTRCLQTAGMVYPHHEPTIVSGLMEINFGVLEGLTYDEVAAHPVGVPNFSSEDFAFPEGESMMEFSKRCYTAFSDISHLENIAIFTHGGVIMSLMAQLFNEPFDTFYVENGCGYILSIQDDKLTYKSIMGE